VVTKVEVDDPNGNLEVKDKGIYQLLEVKKKRFSDG